MDEHQPRYEGWRVVAASGVAVFFASSPFHTFGVFLRPIVGEFGWTREAASAAYAVLALGAAVAAPIVGRVIDRVGARRTIVPCLAIAGLAVVSLAALSRSLLHLYFVFGVLGLATIGTSPVAHSRVVFSWFERRRGRALGCMLAGAALAGIVLPPAIQALIRVAGWRWAYFALGSSTLLIGWPIVLRFLRERREPGDHVRTEGVSHQEGVSLGEALKTRAFWTLVAVIFTSTIAMNGATVHLAALLTDRGVPAGQAALAISAMSAASLAGRLLTGWLLDRFSAVRVAAALLVLAASGTLLLADAQTLAAGVLAAVLIGFGSGGETDVIPYLLSRFFGMRAMSTLYGLNWTAWGFAAMLGPILMGRAFDATGSYEKVLVQFSVVTFASAVIMLSIPSVGVRRRSAATA